MEKIVSKSCFKLGERIVIMNRRESRELAFVLLFEQAVTGENIPEIILSAEELRGVEVSKFATRLVCGADKHLADIDAAIGKHAKGWTVSRLSKVSVALLRLSLYEMMYEKEIPVSVTINEAVDLAKVYGGKDDAPYINGVLSGASKDTSLVCEKKE